MNRIGSKRVTIFICFILLGSLIVIIAYCRSHKKLNEDTKVNIVFELDNQFTDLQDSQVDKEISAMRDRLEVLDINYEFNAILNTRIDITMSSSKLSPSILNLIGGDKDIDIRYVSDDGTFVTIDSMAFVDIDSLKIKGTQYDGFYLEYRPEPQLFTIPDLESKDLYLQSGINRTLYLKGKVLIEAEELYYKFDSMPFLNSQKILQDDLYILELIKATATDNSMGTFKVSMCKDEGEANLNWGKKEISKDSIVSNSILNLYPHMAVMVDPYVGELLIKMNYQPGDLKPQIIMTAIEEIFKSCNLSKQFYRRISLDLFDDNENIKNISFVITQRQGQDIYLIETLFPEDMLTFEDHLHEALQDGDFGCPVVWIWDK